MNWPEIWYGTKPASRLLRTLLVPASWLYSTGWTLYRGLYRFGIKRPQQPYAPILCVGNLTVGGSGKTPMTIHVVRCLIELGCRPVVGCSGYGSPAAEGATWSPEGPLDPTRWGDEPALIRESLPDVPIVVGRRRVLAARLVAERATPVSGAGQTVLVMDDGFQHLPLRKTASILLNPPESNRWCLPAGPFREPVSNMRWADLVLTAPPHPGFGKDGEFLRINSTIVGLEDLHTGEVREWPIEADALCGIGRPQAFFEALEQRVNLRQQVALPDHSPMEGALERVSDPVLVTGKDAVKLRQMSESLGRDIRVVRHEVSVEPHDQFLALLKEWIERG